MKTIHSASEIAKEIIALSQPDLGDGITNLKLQKLLYYVQGFHLAHTNTPLFKEDITAWQYGPVVVPVYHEYKTFGVEVLPQPVSFESSLNEKQQALLSSVYNVYGQYSALKLMEMTHRESPWLETPIEQIIEPKLIKDYFLSIIK